MGSLSSWHLPKACCGHAWGCRYSPCPQVAHSAMETNWIKSVGIYLKKGLSVDRDILKNIRSRKAGWGWGRGGHEGLKSASSSKHDGWTLPWVDEQGGWKGIFRQVLIQTCKHHSAACSLDRECSVNPEQNENGFRKAEGEPCSPNDDGLYLSAATTINLDWSKDFDEEEMPGMLWRTG